MSLFDHIMEKKSPATVIAVVGASANPNKYGYIIPRELLRHGYTIVPVNPRGGVLGDLGLSVVPAVSALPRHVDVVNVVTPPEVTVDVLAECAAAGCTRIWLQPGSFDDVVLQEAATLRTPSGDRLEVESDACIMVVAARVGR